MFFSLQNDDNERANSKRKRLKSTDSNKVDNLAEIRAKNQRMAKALNLDAREDGELSDDDDDDDDDSDDYSYREHRKSPEFHRKQIVYEIDDSTSSNDTDQNDFSGEQISQLNTNPFNTVFFDK